MTRITKEEVRRNIKRVNELTNKKYRLYSAYGHYGLVKEVNKNGGERSVKTGISLRETNLLLLGMLEVLEG